MRSLDKTWGSFGVIGYLGSNKECIDKRITVDLFVAITPKYPSIDAATLAPICGITGGDLFVY